MTANSGPGSSDLPLEQRPLAHDPNDHTSGEARMSLATDIRALNHLHVIEEWAIEAATGDLVGRCSCTGEFYTAAGPSNHWAQQVRKVRGLDKLPKPKSK